jgi:hypothetical protein
MSYIIKTPTPKEAVEVATYLVSKKYYVPNIDTFEQRWEKYMEKSCLMVHSDMEVRLVNIADVPHYDSKHVTFEEFQEMITTQELAMDKQVKTMIQFYWQFQDMRYKFDMQRKWTLESQTIINEFRDFLVNKISENGYILIDGNKFIKRESLENLPNTITKHDILH